MLKNNNNFNICIFFSLGLHSLVLAFITNFSQNFISSKSSIIEVKIEKYSEDINLNKLNESLSFKQKKTKLQNILEVRKLNKIDNINLIKSTQNSSEIHKYKDSEKSNYVKNKLITPKKMSNKEENVVLKKSSPNYQIKKKKNLITQSRAEYKIGSHNNPHPKYPLIARKRGWEGRVVIQADIDKTGNVTYIKVLKSSGFKVLDNVSLSTLKEWRFTPAKSGKKFIKDSIHIPVNFVLED
ncbi:MAG: energy transducer TonB [Alphaproteobacteria bacterium]